VRSFSLADLETFLADRRPDGPLFGLAEDDDVDRLHVVVPEYVRGHDYGWFLAFCYCCRRSHRVQMRGPTYFDPFTGKNIGAHFDEALSAGGLIRVEWIRRRKLLRITGSSLG
jgi:hypothetical protein